jgi:hypothetical protein
MKDKNMKTIRVIVNNEMGETVALLDGRMGDGAAAAWKAEQGEAVALKEAKEFLRLVSAEKK